MPYIEPNLDWGQYGGISGCSVTHLMIELLTFVHYNLDFRQRHGVTLTALDYSKAFNRQNHNNFLILLHKLKVPGWLLNIVMGFLKNRTMVLSFDGGISDPKNMPGGGPAGTTLGLFMFIVLINDTARPGNKIPWGNLLTSPLRGRKPIVMTHGKLIDDATIGEAINMEKVLNKPQEDF